jgi:serine phosphatase RsbU (regulator of sigma subunit)/ligand-binding sensor domain-containing protein
MSLFQPFFLVLQDVKNMSLNFKYKSFKLVSLCIYALFVCFLFALNPALAQTIEKPAKENGLLPLQNYSSKVYKARPQNWAIIQDKRGIMYFGNNGGVLEYDGVFWRVIPVKEEVVVRSLAIDSTGRIYVGSQGEVGYLSADFSGDLKYVSLLDLIPEEERDFADVWKIFISGSKIYFHTNSRILILKDKEFTSIKPETIFARAFLINEKLYVYQNSLGLGLVENGQISTLKNKEEFKDKGVTDIVPLGERLLLTTRKNGLFTISADATEQDYKIFNTSLGEDIKKSNLHNCLKINDNLYSIGTWGDGVFLFDASGNFLRVINKEAGLQDGIINYQFIDREGNLWLALSNGIAKVSASSSVTVFNDRSGIKGTIETLVRHDDIFYAGTHTGIYYLTSDNQKEIAGNYQPVFMPVIGASSECWGAFSFEHKGEKLLLASFNEGIYEIKKDLSRSLIYKCAPWGFFQSKKNPDRVFIGLDNGVASILRSNGKWIPEGQVKDVSEMVLKIDEDGEGNIWLGTVSNTVIKLENATEENLKDVKLVKYDTSHGLPEGQVLVNTSLGYPLFSTYKGLYLFKDNKFEPYEDLNKLFDSKSIHRLSVDPSGNIWLVLFSERAIEVGFIDFNKTWHKTPFIEISREIIHAFHHDKDGITWLGGPDGLFRFDASVEKDYRKSFQTTIRRVVSGEDSVLFKGAFTDEGGKTILNQLASFIPQLKYSTNSVAIEYAAQSFESEWENRYSYFLEGFDKEWTDWKEQSKTVYTNLPEGTYRFRVKAKNAFGHISEEASYEFIVLPPWYRTIWAFSGYVLLLIGFVYTSVQVSVYRLKKAKIKLEEIVKERTAEIVKQKDEIALQKQEITDSINYAQRIQQAILPPYEGIKKAFPESFVLFKPKDIVSGDFYWFHLASGQPQHGEVAYIASADCTGHGVPGAFMSMIGVEKLNEAVKNNNLPGDILKQTNRAIKTTLHQSGSDNESRDGMDIALLNYDFHSGKIKYSGANRPLWIIRAGHKEIEEIKATKCAIAGFTDIDQEFENHEVELKAGDTLYIFSDGYADQFGGHNGKKLMTKKFKDVLISIQNLTMPEQEIYLDKFIEDWKKPVETPGKYYEQVDDILVIGIRA